MVCVPSSSASSRSSCSGVLAVAANARAHASWSLPRLGGPQVGQLASVQRVSSASRAVGAAYWSMASFTWRCSDCTTPMSDSLPMPDSTSER